MNPWVLLGFVVALVAAVAGGEWDGTRRGTNAERVTWQARENTELAAANKKIHDLEEKARKVEQDRAADLDRIATVYEGKLADAEKQKDLDVARARSGALSLRIPTSCKAAGGGVTSQAAATPGSGNGGETTELPREIAANLFALADDADEVVNQLTACQAVVREDRAAGSSLPAR